MSSPSKRTVYIASDHAGFAMKQALLKAFSGDGDFEWVDHGPADTESVDYTDYAERVADDVLWKPHSVGVLICGTGIGMCIAANKFKGIRAALVSDVTTAKLTREHNDSNILCLAGKHTPIDTAIAVVKAWLATPFSNEERHERRLWKLSKLEEKGQRR